MARRFVIATHRPTGSVATGSRATGSRPTGPVRTQAVADVLGHPRSATGLVATGPVRTGLVLGLDPGGWGMRACSRALAGAAAATALLLAGAGLGAQQFYDPPELRQARASMVASQLRARDITDPEVLEVMGKVRRHLFVPERLTNAAYRDSALPIDDGQTISQPYIVALMTQTLGLEPDDRVLEVGTGSGYQAAVLAELVQEVFTIEIRPFLHGQSRERLERLGYSRVSAHLGDGYFGLDEHAPFDHIMITAAVDHIPPPLLEQLRVGGTMILPLGNPFAFQNLVLVTRTAATGSGADYTVELILGVLFVPMTGRALDG